MNAPALDLAAVRHRRRGVSAVMGEVMLALVPGTLLYAWLIGPRVLANVALAVIAALALEALALHLRARPVRATLADGSIALAAWLLALALPPGLPPGQLLVGVVAMVLLGKHLYGGLGHNPFNPAMVGYAVLIVSFPITMTTWPASAAPPPSTIERTVYDTAPGWDALTGATPLDRLRTLERERRAGAAADVAGPAAGMAVPTQMAGPTKMGEPTNMAKLADVVEPTGTTGPTDMTGPAGMAEPADVVGPGADESSGNASTTTGRLANAPETVDERTAPSPGRMILHSPWPWVNGGFLAGGLWLLARGVIGWRIPVAVLGTLGALHAIHGALAAVPQPPVHAELLAGAAILGAFFIATDPVSAASGPRARLVYGAGIGGLTFALREFGAYPEGIAFAVLLMNATVPLLDRLSRSSGALR